MRPCDVCTSTLAAGSIALSQEYLLIRIYAELLEFVLIILLVHVMISGIVVVLHVVSEHL